MVYSFGCGIFGHAAVLRLDFDRIFPFLHEARRQVNHVPVIADLGIVKPAVYPHIFKFFVPEFHLVSPWTVSSDILDELRDHDTRYGIESDHEHLQYPFPPVSVETGIYPNEITHGAQVMHGTSELSLRPSEGKPA